LSIFFLNRQTFLRAEGAGGRGHVAMKSVGAKFSEQLKDLRSRINATAPHYIRCLKPNDELLPDEFDPKQIVEQLRYSGVLEAVRVSRAGYPTRYLHGQFMSRYYMLGDLQDGTKRNNDIFQLIKFISKHVWEADLKRTQAREAVARSQKEEKQVSEFYSVLSCFVICTLITHQLVSHNTGRSLLEEQIVESDCSEEEKENERAKQHRNS
jgi:hypothetical protein